VGPNVFWGWAIKPFFPYNTKQKKVSSFREAHSFIIIINWTIKYLRLIDSIMKFFKFVGVILRIFFERPLESQLYVKGLHLRENWINCIGLGVREA